MDRKPNVVEFFVLEPSMARMALSRVARERMVRPAPESRSGQLQETVGKRRGLNCCQIHLNPESICSLAHFSVFSFWHFRVQTVATAMNATKGAQRRPHRTHTRALFLAAHATCDYTFASRALRFSVPLEKSIHHWSCLVECSFDPFSSYLLTVCHRRH